MTELTPYQLMEDVYNDLITSGGLSEEEAWTKVLNEYQLYEYRDDVDTPQDSDLLNVRGKNLQWLIRKHDEMMRKYEEKMKRYARDISMMRTM